MDDTAKFRCSACGIVVEYSLPLDYDAWLWLESHAAGHDFLLNAHFESLLDEDARATKERRDIADLERWYQLEDPRY